MITPISREEIEILIKHQAPLTLVEALPERFFDEAHLPGAVRINVGEAKHLAPGLLPDKSARIAVYCSNTACQNSTKVAHELLGLGYTHVFKYGEGKQDWIEAGLPTEK